MSDGPSGFKSIWDLSPSELDLLKKDVNDYLNGLRIVHIGFIITATILVWDIITTWDREAHYVWKTRWSYAKFIFLFNRYLGPSTFLAQAFMLFWTPKLLSDCIIMAWIWLILCTLAGTVGSSILAARLWALYEQDRRVLAALIIGFLGCFVPGWTLSYSAGASSIDPDQLRIIGSVFTYSSGVTVQEGYDAVDWRLKKCHHFPFSKVSISILIGSLLYESGIFAALIWKMCRDQKRTRIIEAFYRDGVIYYLVIFSNYAVAIGTCLAWNNPLAQAFATSAFYIGVKSMTCSHIILRLRSYFSQGDPIVDGPVEPDDPFDETGKFGGNSFSSSLVSTVIYFAQMMSRNGGTTFEMQSTHLSREEERPTADLGPGAEAEEGRGRASSSPGSPSPTPLRQSVDWLSASDSNNRPLALGGATFESRSDSVVGPSAGASLPSRSARPKWFGRRPRTSAPAQRHVEGNSNYGQPLWQFTAAGSREEPLTIVEMDDLSSGPRKSWNGQEDHDGYK